MDAAAAASELLARRRARASLAAWVDYLQLGIRPARHHSLLIDALESVERGDCDRLMVCMPPGSAKSTYSSVLFPSWYLGRNPEKSVIAASHTSELAERFGRKVRNIVGSPEAKSVFKLALQGDNAAAGRWETSKGGEYFAAGVGGSVTGRRADLAIIDDPVKSREDADSERSRVRAWDWYVNDLLTRLKPGAAIILVMTRWHEDDLGGRILENEPGRWKVIELPMEAMPDDPLGREVGERLWPEWFTDEMVQRAKMDVRSWNALYQQQPASEEGDYFKREWFPEYEVLPADLSVIGASDYGVTEGGGDYTEHGIAGADSVGNLYLLDWWRGQASSDVWIESFCDLVQQHSPALWAGESGVIRRSVEPYLRRRMAERNVACRVEWLPPIGDKPARARSIQALMASGRVFWPKQASWKAELQGQLLRFPAGKYDDGVDVMGLFGRALPMLRTTKKVTKAEVIPTMSAWARARG